MIEEHHEADDEENQTNGHEELFVVMTGRAVFMIDGEEIDAPPGNGRLANRCGAGRACVANPRGRERRR
jgi:hypothetical protein